MKLIDADELLKTLMEEIPLAENVNIFKDIIDAQPTAFDVDKVVKELDEELKLADEEKLRCIRENILQFDEAKGYARGVSCSIDIVKAGGKAE